MEELKALRQQVTELQKMGGVQPKEKIPLPDFCREFDVTRPTPFSWNKRGLITMEKLGGRWYVLRDSISIQRKYQRDGDH